MTYRLFSHWCQARLLTSPNFHWNFVFAASQTCFCHSKRRYIPAYTNVEKLFNPSRLKSKHYDKYFARFVVVFADDAAVAAHSPSHLQFLMDRFANECTVFGLIISTRSISKSQHKKLHRLLSLPSTIN